MVVFISSKTIKVSIMHLKLIHEQAYYLKFYSIIILDNDQ